jgi:hypothetical protein
MECEMAVIADATRLTDVRGLAMPGETPPKQDGRWICGGRPLCQQRPVLGEGAKEPRFAEEN